MLLANVGMMSYNKIPLWPWCQIWQNICTEQDEATQCRNDTHEASDVFLQQSRRLLPLKPTNDCVWGQQTTKQQEHVRVDGSGTANYGPWLTQRLLKTQTFMKYSNWCYIARTRITSAICVRLTYGSKNRAIDLCDTISKHAFKNRMPCIDWMSLESLSSENKATTFLRNENATSHGSVDVIYKFKTGARNDREISLDKPKKNRRTHWVGSFWFQRSSKAVPPLLLQRRITWEKSI